MPYPYAYSHYGYYGKRSAEAEPKADADPYPVRRIRSGTLRLQDLRLPLHLRILRQEVCLGRARGQALLLRRILRWLRPSLLRWIRIQSLLGINDDPRHPDLVLATTD